MADFNRSQGDFAPVEPTTKAPMKSGTPKTGFTEAPLSKLGETGPGEGIPGSKSKIR